MQTTRKNAGSAAIAQWAGRFVASVMAASTPADVRALIAQADDEIGVDGCSRACGAARAAVGAIRLMLA